MNNLSGFLIFIILSQFVTCQEEQLTLDECFDKYERGVYAHPSDCTKFLSCATTDPLDCPAGLHFNSATFVCDWPADAGCIKTTVAPPPPSETTPENDKNPSTLSTNDSDKSTEKPDSKSTSPELESTTIKDKSDASPATRLQQETTSANPDNTVSDADTKNSEFLTPKVTTPLPGDSSAPTEDTPVTNKESTSASDPAIASTPEESKTEPTTLSANSESVSDTTPPESMKPTGSEDESTTESKETALGSSNLTEPEQNNATGSTEKGVTTPHSSAPSSDATEAAKSTSSEPGKTDKLDETTPDSKELSSTTPPSTESSTSSKSTTEQESSSTSSTETAVSSSSEKSTVSSSLPASTEQSSLPTTSQDTTPAAYPKSPASPSDNESPIASITSPKEPDETTESKLNETEPISSSQAPEKLTPTTEVQDATTTKLTSTSEAPKSTAPSTTKKPTTKKAVETKSKPSATTPLPKEKPKTTPKSPLLESTKAPPELSGTKTPPPLVRTSTKAPKCDGNDKECKEKVDKTPQEEIPVTKEPSQPEQGPNLGNRFKESEPEPERKSEKKPELESDKKPAEVPGNFSLKSCLAKYKFGIFPHPSDPTKFFMCTKSKPLEMTCPTGLEFDINSFGCDRPKPTTPPPPPELNLKQCIMKYKKGVFPHPSDCSRFYSCSKFGPVEMQCPLGLNFHPIKMVCDWPSRQCVSPAARTRDKIFRSMKGDKIVPDVVDRCPENLAEVAFPSGGQVNLGKELTPTQTLKAPSIYWQADKKSYYTLCMVDPDAPKPKDSKTGQWNHWLVGNIPGNNIRLGQTLAEYLPSCPQQGSGPHRYTYLIYKQNGGRVNFQFPKIPATSFINRQGFSIKNFAQMYNLGSPVAGNYFKCNWDNSVPQIYKRIGFMPFRSTHQMTNIMPQSYKI